MKKLLVVISIALMGISVNAQKNNTPEAKAERISKEIQSVLEFDEATYKKVHALQLDRFQKEAALKEKTGDDNEAYSAGKKEIMQEMNPQLKELLGKEEIRKWQDYVKEKRKKKEQESKS